jgi:DNA-binding MarR family transcriptional regulator
MAHALVEIAGGSHQSALELQRQLAITQPASSKLISELQARGFIKVRTSPQDARRRDISLTKDGIKMLALFDAAAEKSYRKFASMLSKAELSELESYLNLLADGLNAPPSCTRSTELSLRNPLRRLTRAFGLLSQNYADSGLSTIEWQTLNEVLGTSSLTTVGELAQKLGAPQNSMSQAIGRLVRRKLAKLAPDTQDRRRRVVQITPLGVREHQVIEQRGVRPLTQALSSIEDITRFRNLLERFVGARADSARIPIDDSFSLQAVKTDAERAIARALAIRLFSHKKLEELFPTSTFSSDSHSFLLILQDTPEASIEFKQDALHYISTS